MVALVAFGWWVKQPRDPTMAFVVAAAVTLLAAPYVLMYDYLILLAPITYLVVSHDVENLWLPAVILSWSVLFSAILVQAMDDAWGFGIQIATVALTFAVLMVVRVFDAPYATSRAAERADTTLEDLLVDGDPA